MEEKIEALIHAAASRDAVNFKELFKDIMADKVVADLELIKQGMKETIFNEEPQE